MKNFFPEFKKFVTRGNVVDMSVGVIVGSSFTAIVNGLSNFILKPLINALLYFIVGADALDKIYTFLVKAYVLDEAGNATAEVDLANSIYIDWGSFINAVINFFLVAIVLFTIVKVINSVREGHKKTMSELMGDFATKEERREMKKLGLDYKDTEVVALYRKQKAEEAKAAEEKAKAEAEEKARLERLANPTTEDLLKEIRDIMKQSAK